MNKFDPNLYLRLMDIPIYKMTEADIVDLLKQMELFNILFTDVVQQLVKLDVPFKDDLKSVNRVLTHLLQRKVFEIPKLYEEYHKYKENKM